jgi:hypothetical protein
MKPGEVVVGITIAALGAGWLALALKLPYMGEFAPGSGFLPVWLAGVLTVLAVVFVIRRVRAGALTRGADEDGEGGLGRPALVSAGLFVCVAVIEWLGFVPSVTLYILFLVRVVEGHLWRVAAALALGTSLSLWLLFKVWLKVPLPVGPLGF